MPKYLKQYDLPGYPNDNPVPGCRTIIGLQRGSFFEPQFKGFSKWYGGCGIGTLPEGTSFNAAVQDLQYDARLRLQNTIIELTKKLAYQQNLLVRWLKNPEQFAVTPEER